METDKAALDKAAMLEKLAGFKEKLREFGKGLIPSHEAEEHYLDDFATKPEIPTWEEYAMASNEQILERLHRNPAGLLNEQPFIDTLMNVRNAENSRKQTRYLAWGFYALAFGVLVSVFKSPAPIPMPPPDHHPDAGQFSEQAMQEAISLTKQEFQLKLQGKELEINELKRQISLLNQSHADLVRLVKAIPKAAVARPAAPLVKAEPAPQARPKEPVHNKPVAKPEHHAAPTQANPANHKQP